ncbi:MAG: signal peptide peptidase SppA [Bacteroidales bacterium]|nr:signal peptide peptidase SppA [Bacteroidales bacterium]
MKDFVKMTLAVICGLFIMSIISFFLMIGFFGSLAATGSTSGKTVLPREGILKMDLSTLSIVEQPEIGFSSFSSLQSGMTGVSLWKAVQAINAAAADPSVKMIYLKADGSGMSLAATEEVRKALENFRLSGKPVIAWTESPGTGSYWLSSVADKVYMSSAAGAGPMMTGVGTRLIFLKDILDKFGVNVQLIRHGKYKSAGEMYIRSTPSPENLEQNQVMINSIWSSISQAVEESRSLEPGTLTAMIDNLSLSSSKDMLESGLVDLLLSKEEMRLKIAQLAGKESFSDVKFIQFADYADAKVLPKLKADKEIAIIFANGSIVEGDDPKAISGDRFATMISEIRKDDKVKAVVFRVNSPGGSVLASDKIKNEIDLLRKEKPVIASYGDYAASGGYWISNSCDHSFTDRTTLTGSIGVFSMIPDLSKTAKDVLHVGVTSVGSSKHSDMFSGTRPLDKDELAYMQASIEDIYGKFVGTVAEGRGIEPEYVDSIAQGRVWTGAESVDLKLTDAIGTLEDAVKYAAIVVSGGDPDLSGWAINGYPAELSPMETILAMIQEKTTGDTDVLAGTPFSGIERAFKGWDFNSSEKVFARMPYQYEIK